MAGRPHQHPGRSLPLSNKKRLEQATPENARTIMTPEQQQRTNDILMAMQAQRDQALNANVNLIVENAGLAREVQALRETVEHLKTLIPPPTVEEVSAEQSAAE